MVIRVVSFLFVLVGCSSDPAAVAPQRGPRHKVVCKHWSNQCYYKAQAICPQGYTVLDSVESEKTGGPHGRYREYTIHVACKQ